MPANLAKLVALGLAQPPLNLEREIQFESYMGSAAYGCSSDTSDIDVYGWCIPKKILIFPHLNGEIEGFGKKGQRFKTYQQHAIVDKSAQGGKGTTYDYQIYSIVEYFNLTMQNNPNMIDSLFVPERCIMFQTPIGAMVRNKRHMFLTKRIFHTCKGYAYQQLHKLRIKEPTSESKRYAEVQRLGYDPKFAYHIVRLIDQAHMVLTEGDLDLEFNREKLKSIRRGEWSLEKIEDYFKTMEKTLDAVAEESKLPWGPPEDQIRNLLMECLEQHFGSLSGVIVQSDRATRAMESVRAVLNAYDLAGEAPLNTNTLTGAGNQSE